MPQQPTSHAPDTEHGTLRCVIDDSGRVVFASPALGWALDVNAEQLAGQKADSILNFISGDISKNAPESGIYDVALLRPKRDPQILSARVDRIQAAKDRTLTVIWLDPDNGLRDMPSGDARKAAEDLAAFIGNHKPSTDTREHAATPIQDHDGELRHFLNMTSELLAVCTINGTFLRTNTTFNQTLGFSDTDLKNLSFVDIVIQEDKAHMTQVFESLVQENSSAETEARMLCQDGSQRQLAWKLKAADEHIYIVGDDITRIRSHEEELTRRERQLAEAQKIGRMGSWHWNARTKDITWSDQMYDIFGVRKDVLIPSLNSISALVLKRDLGRLHKCLYRAMVRKRDFRIEFRIRRPGSGVRYMRCEGGCKVDSDTGELTAMYGIVQDATENTLHEKALQAAKESAEHAYASRARFLANMSHELRTPLNAIIGFSEMIQRQLLGPIGQPRYLDYIGGIRESGEHLLDLINDILDMSKIEVGKYELHAEDMNIGKVIRLAIHMIEGRAHESQLRLIADDIADDIHITADRRALMQVLLNLLSNAVKFTAAGGSIEVKCRRDLSGVAISVSDTGIGIPAEKISAITQPFEQVDSEFTRRHEGSGLGLSITKSLVELHGGRLDIHSEVGVGTTMTVLLPDAVPAKQRKSL
ncbi:MAG: ATP-binding protein [Alphaproteobacteria bacterium]|nr:ATP-binding protein [Alphaproteobacteria bacterium]